MSAALAAAAFVVAACAFFLRVTASEHRRARVRFNRLPPRRIADLAHLDKPAVVRLRGTVVCPPDAPLAPIGGERAVAWHLIIEESRADPRSHYWVQLAEARAERDFILDDGTGEVTVRATLASVRLHAPVERLVLAGTDGDPQLSSLLAAHPELARHFARPGRRARIRLATLVDGSVVTVCGPCQREADPSGGTYREMSTRIVVAASRAGEVQITHEQPADEAAPHL